MNQPSVTTIDLLRHGACQDGDIFRGHTDSLLSLLGRQQMQQALAQHPNKITQWHSIFSSPRQRCESFAKGISDYKIIIKAALAEISFGDWDGKLIIDIKQQSPAAVEQFWSKPAENTPPNGEPFSIFQQRVSDIWADILLTNKGQHNLIITHGGVIRLIIAQILQMPIQSLSFLSIPHACLTQIKIYHHPGLQDWPQLIFHQPLNTPNHSPL